MCALAREYGKRPLYLFGGLTAIIGTIICSTSSTYGVRAGRILQGFSFSPYASIVYSSVGDMFFVHQRGKVVSAFSFLFILI